MGDETSTTQFIFTSDKRLKHMESNPPHQQHHFCLISDADVRMNGSAHKNSLIGITPCFIKIDRQVMGIWTNIITIHLMSIKRVIASDGDEGFLIKSDSVNLIVRGEHHIQIARVLYRNLFIIGQDVFKASSDQVFPPLSFHISAAQMFQFRFYAHTVNKDVPYTHILTKCIHKMIKSRNFIIDPSIVPEGFPFFSFSRALAETQITVALICDSPSHHSPCRMLADLIHRSSRLSYVSITSVTSDESLEKAAMALEAHPERILPVIRIGGGQVKGMRQFINALGNMTTRLRVVDFSGCGMSTSDLTLFLEHLNTKACLLQVNQVGFGGSEFDKRCKQLFRSWLKRLDTNDLKHLRIIDISGVGKYIGRLVLALASSQQPLKQVIMADNKLTEWDRYQVLQLVIRSESLATIDLSNCGISGVDAVEMVRTIGKHSPLRDFGISMGRSKFTPSEVSSIFAAMFDSNPKKWRSIDLSMNPLNHTNAMLVTSIVGNLKKLTSINLSGCLKSSMKGIGEHLSKLTKIKKLRSITLRGSGKCKLKHELNAFLSALRYNRTLERLDISGNAIGNSGIEILIGILGTNTALTSINADKNEINDFNVLSRLINRARARIETLVFVFPREDAQNIIKRSRSREKMTVEMLQMEIDLDYSLKLHRDAKGLNYSVGKIIETGFKNEIEAAGEIVSKSSIMDRYLEHSCISNEFKLPLPYLEEANTHVDTDLAVFSDVGCMEAYDTPSINYHMVEEPPILLEPELEEARREIEFPTREMEAVEEEDEEEDYDSDVDLEESMVLEGSGIMNPRFIRRRKKAQKKAKITAPEPSPISESPQTVRDLPNPILDAVEEESTKPRDTHLYSERSAKHPPLVIEESMPYLGVMSHSTQQDFIVSEKYASNRPIIRELDDVLSDDINETLSDSPPPPAPPKIKATPKRTPEKAKKSLIRSPVKRVDVKKLVSSSESDDEYYANKFRPRLLPPSPKSPSKPTSESDSSEEFVPPPRIHPKKSSVMSTDDLSSILDTGELSRLPKRPPKFR